MPSDFIPHQQDTPTGQAGTPTRRPNQPPPAPPAEMLSPSRSGRAGSSQRDSLPPPPPPPVSEMQGLSLHHQLIMTNGGRVETVLNGSLDADLPPPPPAAEFNGIKKNGDASLSSVGCRFRCFLRRPISHK
jgi:hypothetical protein